MISGRTKEITEDSQNNIAIKLHKLPFFFHTYNELDIQNYEISLSETRLLKKNHSFLTLSRPGFFGFPRIGGGDAHCASPP